MVENNFIDDNSKQAILDVIFSYKKKRESSIASSGLTEEQFRQRATTLRKKVFVDFEDNLKKAKESFKANGFEVFEATDSNAAKDILKRLLAAGSYIVKSKTNTGREVGLEAVIAEGAKSADHRMETDLGDYLVELFREKDLHYVLPAIHLTPLMIAEKVKQVFGDVVAADPTELTHYLCGKIRQNILKADIGITGANFFTVDGRVILLENEGNISLISRLPKKHIVVAGIDKLVGSVEDGMTLCQTAATFGTGQNITQYISVISGPSKTADIQNELVIGAQGAKEIAIVLVDNGRRKMLQEGYEDLLRCINCGACINFCPVYHNLGAKYGGSYIGSKGLLMKHFIQAIREEDDETLERNKEMAFQCTLCGNCFQNCPMKINLPDMVRRLRAEYRRQGFITSSNAAMLHNVKKYGNPFGDKPENSTPDKLYCC